MRRFDLDSLPHLLNCAKRIVFMWWSTFWARILSVWWGVPLGHGCIFHGLPYFRRHPESKIIVAAGCEFLSSHVSNLIGINRPCIISTLAEGAEIIIGSNCGFSGTVVGSAMKIVIGNNVRCGANTLITDTDWHRDDPRTGSDSPVSICDNVWLGLGVTVLKGVTIGENTVVGAGSLVTRSLPANVIAAGSPAIVVRQI